MRNAATLFTETFNTPRFLALLFGLGIALWPSQPIEAAESATGGLEALTPVLKSQNEAFAAAKKANSELFEKMHTSHKRGSEINKGLNWSANCAIEGVSEKLANIRIGQEHSSATYEKIYAIEKKVNSAGSFVQSGAVNACDGLALSLEQGHSPYQLQLAEAKKELSQLVKERAVKIRESKEKLVSSLADTKSQLAAHPQFLCKAYMKAKGKEAACCTSPPAKIQAGITYVGELEASLSALQKSLNSLSTSNNAIIATAGQMKGGCITAGIPAAKSAEPVQNKEPKLAVASEAIPASEKKKPVETSKSTNAMVPNLKKAKPVAASPMAINPTAPTVKTSKLSSFEPAAKKQERKSQEILSSDQFRNERLSRMPAQRAPRAAEKTRRETTESIMRRALGQDPF